MADVEIAPMRTCTKCGEAKPATTEHFGKSKLGKYGLKSRCRICRVDIEREYNRAYCRAYYEENGPALRAAMSAYRESLPSEVIKARRKQGYAANREKILARGRKWRQANPERARAIIDRYEAKNPDVRRVITANRRAREKEAGATLGIAALRALRAGQKEKCWWCSGPLGTAHLDHRIPLARGGDSTAGNMVLACRGCNLKKSSKMPWEMDDPRLL